MLKSIKTRKYAALALVFTLLLCLTPVSVIAAEPASYSFGIVDVKNTTATVRVDASYTGSIVKHALYFEWTTNRGDFVNSDGTPNTNLVSINPSKNIDTEKSSQTVELTELQPNTTYYVRVILLYMDMTAGGLSLDSSRIVISVPDSFRTLAGAVTPGAPTVTTISAEKVNNAIHMQGRIADRGASDITEHGFVYSATKQIPERTDGFAVGSSILSSNDFNSVFDIASSAGVYYVRAYARNKDGATSYGEVKTINLSTSSSAYVTLQSKDYIGANSAQFTINVNVPSQPAIMLIERGIVLAKYPNTQPAIDGAGVIAVNADRSGSAVSGTVQVTAEGLEKNTQYYVRAYVKTNVDTFYSSTDGDLFTTSAEDVIVTLPVTDITNQSVVAGGNIIGSLADPIQKRGVVVSDTHQSPEITNSREFPHAAAGTGEFTVSVTGLAPNKTYYIRAYCQTFAGTTYGNPRSFKTEENTYVRIKDDADIKATEMTVKATVFGDAASNITERGFVYSTTQPLPEISNASLKAAATPGIGDFDAAIIGLDANTKYYVRAYAKDGSIYRYSPVKELTTTNDTIVRITYLTEDNNAVGTQDIASSVGAVITNAQLTPPAGYNVRDAVSFEVTGSAAFNVIVVSASVTTEKPYVKGVGGNMFNPGVPMTRLDVIKSIYNLLGDGKTYASDKTFPDMPTDVEGVNAVNFCTSRKIIEGNDDGTLKPNDGVKRSEMAVILVKAFNMQPTDSITVALTGTPQPNNPSTVTLTDIAEHWSRTMVVLAVQNNAIKGYDDGTFKPENSVTRAEVVTMLCYASKRSLKPLGTTQFLDVKETDWFYNVVMNASIPEP